MATPEQKRELALLLHEIGALQFGTFTYKSGATGPMYLDLRLFISHPKALKKVAALYADVLNELHYDRLAGVAYAALPIAGAISLELEQPWIFMRKEGLKKDYGLQKSLEGEYHDGETVVMIEDLANRATSLLEAIPAIEQHGLKVTDAVVLLDYQKGGSEALAEKGYTLRPVMTVRELVDIMHQEKFISDEHHAKCVAFLEK